MYQKNQSPDNPLAEFGRNLWVIEGPLVKDMGLSFSTRMIIARLTDKTLWICDPVEISDSTRKDIEKLGAVKYLAVTTQRHNWRLHSSAQKYPNAELWYCGKPSGHFKHNAETNTEKFPVKNLLGDTQLWPGDFEQILFKGNKLLSEAVFFHKSSGTVIMGDLIQNNKKIKGRPITNLVFKMSGAAFPDGGVGFDLKLTFTDRDKARESVSRILSWNFDKLIISHGPCVTSNAKEYIKKAFAWL
ncbi:MAG: DUF4336 domain-containing protein [Treponema sp.]|nr:DUF4336 domain-containing protein [Treponema sp.]